MEPIIERLRKIRALVERGERGEAIAASYLLDQQLQKHGLTMSDLDNEVTHKYEYTYFGNDHKMLIMHCWTVVTDDAYDSYKYTKGKRQIFLEMTEMQKMLMDDLLEFHKLQYYKEKQKVVRNLARAYVNKHNLFPDNPKNEGKESTLTFAEIAELSAMMNNMDDKSYHKRLKK